MKEEEEAILRNSLTSLLDSEFTNKMKSRWAKMATLRNIRGYNTKIRKYTCRRHIVFGGKVGR